MKPSSSPNIPAFSLSRQIKQHRPALLHAMQAVLDSEAFVGGTFVQTFEKQLAAYVGAAHAVSCNSGTDALWMALFALKIPKNSIVLTTPFSFIASSSEIVAHEANPVFIDVEKDTLNIDPVVLAAWLNKNAQMKDGVATHTATGLPIVGILAVDLFGQCANYPELTALAKTWGLWIVEDMAQSLGASIGDKKAGTFGTIAALSFYPTKNLGAFGDAGACVTDDPALAQRLAQVRHHGRKAGYDYEFVGINSRMDALQAATLSVKLPLLDDANNRRRHVADLYKAQLAGVPNLTLPRDVMGKHIYHQYGVLLQGDNATQLRNELEKYLADHGIQTRIFYPQSLQSIPFLQTNPALATPCPVADAAVASILCLPMWPELEDAEVLRVCDTIKTFFAVRHETSVSRPLHHV